MNTIQKSFSTNPSHFTRHSRRVTNQRVIDSITRPVLLTPEDLLTRAKKAGIAGDWEKAKALFEMACDVATRSKSLNMFSRA